MTQALVCIDFINEIVGETGKLAQKGYARFTEQHGTLQRLAALQSEFREKGHRVVHVHLGFSPDYADHPANSPLIGGARNGGILQLGTPSTELHSVVGAMPGDLVLVKKRISAFYETGLEPTLRVLGIRELVIAGVATDIAVQSAARDAHDRDFSVEIVGACCAAASQDDHDQALANIAKFARVT